MRVTASRAKVPVAYTEARYRSDDLCHRVDARAISIWRQLMYCRQECAHKGNDRHRVAVTLPCHNWRCPDCAPVNQKKLRAIAFTGDPTHFLTLTYRVRSTRTPDQAAQELTAKWAIFKKRIYREARRDPKKDPLPFGAAPPDGWRLNDQGYVQRQARLTGDTLEYLWVIEATKLGWPHLHVLMRLDWLDTKWISAQWAELIESPVVDIRKAKGQGQRVSYVTKYVGKQHHKFGRCRRWSKSKRYQLRQRSPKCRFPEFPGAWQRVELTLNGWIASTRREGFHAWKLDHQTAFAVRPP